MRDMNNYSKQLDITSLIIERLLPSEEKSTKFDKVIDLIKATASGTPWGVVGQAIETTGKVFNAIVSGNQRAQALKYVKDAYEMRLQAEVEVAKIREQSETRRSQEKIITLYIERSFQSEIDEFSKKIILESRKLDLLHEENMSKVQNEYELAIKKLDNIIQYHLHYIDKTYAYLIRRNEMDCLLYRQYLKFLSDTEVSPSQMISQVSLNYVKILKDSLYSQTTINRQNLPMAMDGLMQLLRYLGSLDTHFISFDKFITQKKTIEELKI